MRLCIIGGIFDKSEAFRANASFTPETLLAQALAARGHEVTTRGHHSTDSVAGFDVVHVHHLGRGAIRAAGSSTGTPLVFTRHLWTRETPMRAAGLRYVVNRSDAVVALSQMEAAMQRHQLRLPSERQYVIPNGIERSVFQYVAPPPTDGPWRLLYIGQLARFKGVHHLLNAVAMLQREHSVELRLAYHVDTELESLRAQARILGLRSVLFLGGMAPHQLAAEYKACHTLVLPSTAREARPSVVSEALMVGRPVVATDVGAVREQIGEFGVIVPPGDARVLADAIGNVLGRYEEFRAQAQAHSQHVAVNCSVDRMALRHEDLYAGVAGRRPRRHRRATALGTSLGRQLAKGPDSPHRSLRRVGRGARR